MIPAQVDLQVWLDTVPGTRPPVVVPQVKSPTDALVHYAMTVIKAGPSGRSNVSQSGNVQAKAGQATALGRFSMSLGPNDECQIELVLLANQKPAGTYRFECPRAS